MKQKIKLILFDLDGVIFDTKINMRLSWEKVRKIFKIKNSFNNYFKYIGLPFEVILKRLGIKKKADKDHKIYIDTARALMQDTGIKTKIIKQYLPIMNQYINKYLADMDFFVNFTLDEEFNETIKSRYRDEFNYHSFSEGEKLRIDLAILFTWREIAKLKNSTNTNLLILDEIFDSSLDSSGTDEFMRILHTTMNKENVFVISHKGDTLLDKFPRVMKFEKYKNFTRMVE